jgi:hypothetical protein
MINCFRNETGEDISKQEVIHGPAQCWSNVLVSRKDPVVYWLLITSPTQFKEL